MREVSFEVYPRSRPVDDPERGDVADLLLAVPYLLSLGVIPPLSVVNEILRSGFDDAGMSGGCRWEPFEIDAEEWQEARAKLEAPPYGHRFLEPPADVRTRQEWVGWIFERRFGMPSGKYLALSRRLDELDTQVERAAEAGDARREHRLRLERMLVGMRLARLTMKYLRPGGA